MPLEDGHDNCVLCLGHQHAMLARDTPQSCMNCFIMPMHTREARCRFFTSKRGGLPTLERPARKMRRASRGKGRLAEPPSECSGAPRASPFSLSVPRAPVSLCVGPSWPPVFSLTGSTMVQRKRTWMWRQYSLQRVGSFPVNSFPQLTLPGESWLTCLGRLLTGQPRP